MECSSWGAFCEKTIPLTPIDYESTDLNDFSIRSNLVGTLDKGILD